MSDDVPKKEDGGTPQPDDSKNPRIVTPQTISEILIRASKGNANPTLTEEQLRTQVKFFRQGSHIPSYMNLKDFLEKRPDLSPGDRVKALEEVRVWAKKNNIQVDWALILQGLRAGGRYDKRLGWMIEGADLLLAVLEYLDAFYKQDQTDDTNIAIQETLEEIIVKAEPTDGYTSLADFQNAIEDVLVETTGSNPFSGYGMEEVLVTAPRIGTKVSKTGISRTGSFNWDDVAAAIQLAKIPNARTNLETAVSPAPALAPRQGFSSSPETNTLPEDYLTDLPEINGSVKVQVDATSGISITNTVRSGERTRLEENRLRGRGERKNEKSMAMYRAFLRFVNQTWGVYDEWREILVAFLQNSSFKGRPLSSYENWKDILVNNFDELTIDWEGFIQDVAAQQVEDVLYGKAGRAKRKIYEDSQMYPIPRSPFEPPGG